MSICASVSSNYVGRHCASMYASISSLQTNMRQRASSRANSTSFVLNFQDRSNISPFALSLSHGCALDDACPAGAQRTAVHGPPARRCISTRRIGQAHHAVLESWQVGRSCSRIADCTPVLGHAQRPARRSRRWGAFCFSMVCDLPVGSCN